MMQKYPPSAARIRKLISESNIRATRSPASRYRIIRDLTEAKTALLAGGQVHTSNVFDVGYMVVNIDYALKNLHPLPPECNGLPADNPHGFEYGENPYQLYYDHKFDNGDYIVIMATKQYPDTFTIHIEKGDCRWVVGDKQYNDRVRKKHDGQLPRSRLLSSDNIPYLIKKAIHCYENGKREVTP